MGRGLVIGVLVLGIVGGGFLALQSAPVGAQRAEEGAAGVLSSRYRVTVLRVSVPENSTGDALSLTEFAREIPGALVARSDAPGLKGQFAAVPAQKDLVHQLGLRGTAMEVIFTGETETVPGRKATVSSGQKSPVVTAEVRGTQRIVTTRFERIGLKVEIGRALLPSPGADIHSLVTEFSAISAFVGKVSPVIFEVTSRGDFLLPDGYTLILSYLDRVEGRLFMHTVDSLAAGESGPLDVPADVVVQYYILISRMDLE